MIKIKNVFVNRIKCLRAAQIVYFAVILLLIGSIYGLKIYKEVTISKLYDQQIGQRWTDETRYGQVSMFFTEALGMNANTVSEYEYKINSGLIKDGYQDAASNIKDGTAKWNYCYSALGYVTCTRNLRSIDAVAVGVGGDFFQFHPMRLLSGNYFTGEAVMKDYCILDAELAWQLFGSNDIVGETITIGGIPHYIAGVVKKDDGKYVKAAGMNFPTIYMSFESLGTYGTVDSSVLATNGSLGKVNVASKNDDEEEGNNSDVDTEAKGIVCMEVVMPNPVDNYAKNFVIDKLSLNTNVVDVVDNSIRYENTHLFKDLQSLSTRGMQLKPLIYPYWENNALVYENKMALVLLVQLVIGGVIFIMLAIFAVQSYRHRKWTVGGIINKFCDWKYDIESNMKYHNEKWKYF